MIKRTLILICCALTLAACGLFGKKKPPPPPPEPTQVVIQFEAAGDINPDGDGRASPLTVRIYQLKSYSVFEKADFFSLYDKDTAALGSDLLKKQETLLKPNAQHTVFFKAEDGTKTIGLMGAFITNEGIQWKAAEGIQANKTSVINVFVSRAGITIR
jgi:type VI secretion system protein VasD